MSYFSRKHFKHISKCLKPANHATYPPDRFFGISHLNFNQNIFKKNYTKKLLDNDSFFKIYSNKRQSQINQLESAILNLKF